MAEETIEIRPITHEHGSTSFHVWQDDDGWYGCLSGEYLGLPYKDDDIGPFDSRQKVLEAFQDDLEIWDITLQYLNGKSR